MKCIACGREMSDRGAYYECTNILCDYEEEIEKKEERMRFKPAVEFPIKYCIKDQYL